ncbi:pentachlorophenol monooxygenase [Nakamurella sp. YIM 132087]|uniref:Pentachlorophenol monooxygenase n=1 Tax=Nakamurella alba TaxID=2665158 RepID=A0A7K1FNG7_9ACTN|nr:pentachlorophenol monooxygenase [Nakamurella alba]
MPTQTQVLVAGGGPIGLMAAVELRRRGVDVLIVDALAARPLWAKAIGVQPRTLEILDQIGIVRSALDAGTVMRGQQVYKDGALVGQIDIEVPDQVPYRFAALPQYETERVLEEHLERLGGRLQREVRLLSFTQDDAGVTAVLQTPAGEKTVRAEYLVGADGAHSIVRKTLGIGFEGDAFPESYMLGDVEVDWDLPQGYAVRSSRTTGDGAVDDLLVAIPLPGRKRYRMSMLVPPELAPQGSTGADGITHGFTGGREPELHHIQEVLDRLSPVPVTAGRLRWSSVFRISHRLADRYSVGRAFIAGDAAHIHPPTGAQGMNTGLQDAYNLGWKLAQAVSGHGAPGLLDSYHAERHPVGEEVVGRTVRAARGGGIETGGGGRDTIILREAQLLVGYPDSPLNAAVDGGVAEDGTGPLPGDRAPDATGLEQDGVAGPLRWHEFLRGTGHVLLLWAPDAATADAAQDVSIENVRTYVVRPGTIGGSDPTRPLAAGREIADVHGHLAANYGFGPEPATVLIRPDGYLSFRSAGIADEAVAHHLLLTVGVPRR